MIVFDGKENIFKIDTENNSYVMGIIDEKYLVHIYYGKKLSGTHLAYLLDMDQEYLNDIHINYEKNHHSLTDFLWNIRRRAWEISGRAA